MCAMIQMALWKGRFEDKSTIPEAGKSQMSINTVDDGVTGEMVQGVALTGIGLIKTSIV
jgi:hypothetical protein